MKADQRAVVPLKQRARDPAGSGRWLSLEVHARNEAVSNFIRTYGVWQRPISVFASAFLRPGEVAVDVGAHIGYFATVFADAVGPQGAVHAFEPDPENFALLERNRALNGFEQIACRQIAVADREGEARLHKSAGKLWGGSLLKKPMHDAELAVGCAPLDRLLAGESRPTALVKIDVEGAELSVLEGMAGILERQPTPPAVIMEFSPSQLETQDPGLRGLQDLVSRFGFQVRPFLAHEGPKVLPPRIEPETLARIHRDFLGFGEAAELDLLLIAPDALKRWEK